eukprot:Pgem_evm2s17610
MTIFSFYFIFRVPKFSSRSTSTSDETFTGEEFLPPTSKHTHSEKQEKAKKQPTQTLQCQYWPTF